MLILIKDITVIKDKFIVLLIDKKVDETIAGIANRITKGIGYTSGKKN